MERIREALDNDTFDEFYQKYLNIPTPDYLYDNHNHIYALMHQFPDLQGIRVLRNGLYLGECKKNRFEPSLALALSLIHILQL